MLYNWSWTILLQSNAIWVKKRRGYIPTIKWTMEIGQYDIGYKSRKAIKGQVLADFVAELSYEDKDEDEDEKSGVKRNK